MDYPTSERLERQMALQNKRDLEMQAHRILRGDLQIKEAGPKEYRPEVPEALRGVLLTGMRPIGERFDTREDAIRKHEMAVRMGYLAADVEVEYHDDGTYTPKR